MLGNILIRICAGLKVEKIFKAKSKFGKQIGNTGDGSVGTKKEASKLNCCAGCKGQVKLYP